MTTETERARLIRIAREAIEEHVSRQSAVGSNSRQSCDEPDMGSLGDRRAGVFVTLHLAGDLRGCIGHMDADEPLAESIARCAVAASSADPRFPAVTAAELPGLEIEISMLGAMEPITGPRDVEVGRHGLMIEKGGRRGLLLPQVAVEHEWDASMFLSQTCRKAGLPLDAWTRGAAVWRFEAEVFGDDPPH